MTISLRQVDSGGAADEGCVIKARALTDAVEARGIVEQARREAARVLEEAGIRAEALAEERLREREAEFVKRQADLEESLWRSAADYAQAVGAEWERSIADMETRATALASTAVSRLVEPAPAEDRLRACIRELVAHAGTPDTGVLLVSAHDHESVLMGADRLPWPVQHSAEMAAGTVRLVCAECAGRAHGEARRACDG